MAKYGKDLIVGLDIGTSKVVAVVAKLGSNDGHYEIVGFGRHEASGLRKGVVVNIEQTVSAIQDAIQEAQRSCGKKIYSVFTGIAGSHIRSFNSSGMITIKEKEVTAEDVARVVETAKAINLPTDQQILHVLPQEFMIDGQEGIREPFGMSGIRLEVKVHIVTGAVSAAQNIVKCIRRCGLELKDLLLQPLASSVSVLDREEKELGVALVDIGAGTTDIALFTAGAIRHTAVIPVGGDQATGDLAIALRVPAYEAERIKISSGVAGPEWADITSILEVPAFGDRPPQKLSQYELAEVIGPRMEELFLFIQETLSRSGYEELLSSGIVLTGGTSQLPGICDLAEKILGKPVRIGVPKYSGNLESLIQSPSYSTVVGLLEEARLQHLRGRRVAEQTGSFLQTLRRMKEWFLASF